MGMQKNRQGCYSSEIAIYVVYRLTPSPVQISQCFIFLSPLLFLQIFRLKWCERMVPQNWDGSRQTGLSKQKSWKRCRLGTIKKYRDSFGWLRQMVTKLGGACCWSLSNLGQMNRNWRNNRKKNYVRHSRMQKDGTREEVRLLKEPRRENGADLRLMTDEKGWR